MGVRLSALSDFDHCGQAVRCSLLNRLTDLADIVGQRRTAPAQAEGCSGTCFVRDHQTSTQRHRHPQRSKGLLATLTVEVHAALAKFDLVVCLAIDIELTRFKFTLNVEQIAF